MSQSSMTTIRPATTVEALTAFGKFTVAFNLFEDDTNDARFALLADSVAGEPLWAIQRAVDDFAFNRVERKRLVLPLAGEFAPHVRRLREEGIARDTAEKARATGAGAGGSWAFTVPRSPILEDHVTKERARQLVENRMYPRSSIWCPGSIGRRPDIGTLYGPDPLWPGPRRIPTQDEIDAADIAHAEAVRRERESGSRRPAADLLREAVAAVKARQSPGAERYDPDGYE